jgi:hypothetical protein
MNNNQVIDDVKGGPKKQINLVKSRSKKEIILQELIKRRLLIKKYRNNYRLVSIFLAIVIVVIVGYFIFGISNPEPIPIAIQNKVSFPIFYPKPSKQVVIANNSFKYDKSKGQVIFNISYDKQNITFAQQSSPDSFSADPNFYQSLVQSLNGYASFDSIDGQVNLTLPNQTKDQTAVMNAKGTLLFANSSGKLSQAEWKLLFNTLNNTQPQ